MCICLSVCRPVRQSCVHSLRHRHVFRLLASLSSLCLTASVCPVSVVRFWHCMDIYLLTVRLFIWHLFIFVSVHTCWSTFSLAGSSHTAIYLTVCHFSVCSSVCLFVCHSLYLSQLSCPPRWVSQVLTCWVGVHLSGGRWHCLMWSHMAGDVQ